MLLLMGIGSGCSNLISSSFATVLGSKSVNLITHRLMLPETENELDTWAYLIKVICLKRERKQRWRICECDISAFHFVVEEFDKNSKL